MDSDIAMRLERSHKIQERIYIPPHRMCVVCGAFKAAKFPLCNKCTIEYGYDTKLWPEWLKYLEADRKREIRQLKNAPEEVPPKDE